MPLHLLSKKSWNVYAPENIARVKRDQAEAQAREEENDRQLQEQDAAQRLAILRGEEPPKLPEKNDQAVEERPRKRDYTQNDDRRKRRRLHGEDDTDRDLRLARNDLESRHNEQYGSRERHDKKRRSDAPITDRAGHINLFPVQDNSQASNHKIAEAEAERARKKQELEDQCTMRFSNAAGRDGLKRGPWYAEEKRRQREEMDVVEGKDVWGRPDPSAKHREQARQVSNDPLAFMQQAQSQLKQAEDDRRKWEKEEQGRQSKYDRSDHERKRRHKERDREGYHYRKSSERSKNHRHRSELHPKHRSPERSSGPRGKDRSATSLGVVPDDLSLND